MEEIEKLRSWFRMNGQMDFEINSKGKGEFITYKCADIEELFDKVLSKFKKSPIHSVVKRCPHCGEEVDYLNHKKHLYMQCVDK